MCQCFVKEVLFIAEINEKVKKTCRDRLQTIAYFKMFKFLQMFNLHVIKLSE